jgi:hypothetical protein
MIVLRGEMRAIKMKPDCGRRLFNPPVSSVAMKNIFALSSLLLVISLALAVIAESMGVPLPSICTVPIFVGCYTALTVVGLLFSDYSRPLTYCATATAIDAAALRSREIVPCVPVDSATAWAYQTISA